MSGVPAVVLLSGGLDSATALAIARSQGFECYALSVDYGQRHAVELEAAKRVARAAGVRDHRIMRVDLAGIGGSALTDPSIAVPEQPTTGIPVSGTATYDARTLLGWVKSPFTLTADFGARTIAALIDQDYRYNAAGDSMDYPLAFGIHVAGSAPFSSEGLFEIPLAGTVNYTDSYPLNTPEGPPSQSVTGAMNGAFFGPHAEQVGGTFSLDRANGSQLFQDAFVGQQHP